jgi:hypothetical protein
MYVGHAEMVGHSTHLMSINKRDESAVTKSFAGVAIGDSERASEYFRGIDCGLRDQRYVWLLDNGHCSDGGARCFRYGGGGPLKWCYQPISAGWAAAAHHGSVQYGGNSIPYQAGKLSTMTPVFAHIGHGVVLSPSRKTPRPPCVAQGRLVLHTAPVVVRSPSRPCPMPFTEPRPMFHLLGKKT